MMSYTFPKVSFTTLTIVGIALVPFSSSAAVIDFDNLTTGIVYIRDYVHANRGFVYTEDGFVLNNLGTIEFASTHPGDFRYFGSVHFYNNGPNGITRLTRADGLAFDINSIDLNSLNGAYAVPVTFVGQKSGNGTAIQSFTTDALPGFETFFFDNDFDNVTEVSWVQVDPSHYFDNIVIDQAVSVPEPSTANFFVGILAAFGLACRTKGLSKLLNFLSSKKI